MQRILPFLWFEQNVEEAANFYTSVFKDSEIIDVMKTGDGSHTISVTFRIKGQELIAFNGGPRVKFTEAFSLFVLCDSQDEIDEYWEKLIADGGAPVQCGWLKDKYGISWQIVPVELGKMLTDKDPVRAQRTMEAMMKMVKLDLVELRRVYDQA